jgi:C4-dicarboxylate transporter DctQ subunit
MPNTKTLKSILEWLDSNIEAFLLILTLFAMMVLIFGQTALRFTIGKTPSWTQELAQFIQVYFVYIGATYAIKRDVHIRITALGHKLPASLHGAFDMIGLIGFLIFSVILIVWGVNLCAEIKNFNQVSAALQLPMYIPYLAVPLGGLAMSLRLIQRIRLIWRSNGRPDASQPATFND